MKIYASIIRQEMSRIKMTAIAGWSLNVFVNRPSNNYPNETPTHTEINTIQIHHKYSVIKITYLQQRQ